MTSYGAGKQGTPAFEIRGIVEGFYGTPWTHDQRLDAIRFIGERGMNTFVYAPKDDAMMRRDWGTPYSSDDLERIGALVDACGDAGVDFVYCISPGLSIRYSSDADVARLIAKLEAVRALGVRRFGLLLDDIPARLQHDDDVAAFASLPEAQSRLANRVAEALRKDGEPCSLIVCPTIYWGTGEEPDIVELAQLLHDDIDLFWTGRTICSPWIDTEEAERFARATGRRPVYWDNYPVNDVAMGHELHVGPYRGRAADLDRAALGVIANGMDRYESSKIAFATIADYLWAPGTYDPEASWRTAISDVAGAADADAYRDFADNSRSSCLNLFDAPEVSTALEKHAFALQLGDRMRAADALAPLAARLQRSADHLLRGDVSNRALRDEAEPWLRAFEVGARALGVIADLTRSGRLDSDGPEHLRPLLEEFRAHRRRMFGDALDMTLDDLCRSR
jgi:hyaluronoglucosaminidase